MNKKVALYVRVSTEKQTTENQQRELEVYCKRQGWHIVKIYDDSGVSGSIDSRPALDRMLKDATTGTGKFSAIVCWKIDRMARSVVNLLQTLQTLQAAGVGFVSMTQQIDTTTPYGRMVLTFLGAISEFEKSLIQERVCSGLKRAKANGVKLGRPRVAVDVAGALKLRNQGLGYKQIAKQLGLPRTTVYRTLKAIPQTPVAKSR